MSNVVSHIYRLIDQVTRPARAMAQSVRGLGAMVSRNAKTMRQWGQSATIAGGILSAASLGIASQLAKPINASIEFNAAMSKVAAITRSTGPEMAALTKRAKELGATTAFTATQVADAQGFLGLAGFTSNEILKGLPATLNLARAGALELGQASDIASDIMTGFGLEAANLTDVTDVLAATFTRSNTSLPQLYEAMKIGAPIAKIAGISLRETAVAMGILADAGLKGSVGGTGFAAAVSRLSAPTGEAASALAALGIQTRDSEHNLRPLPVIFKELKQSLDGFGNAQQLGFLNEIFGQEHAKAAGNFADAAASPKWREALKAMTDVSGIAKQTSDTMGNNLKGDITQLNSAMEGLFITIGDSVEPVLRTLAQVVTPIIQGFNEFAAANPELAKWLTVTALALAGVLAVVATTTLAVGIMSSGFGTMASGASVISSGMARFGGVLARLLLPAIQTVTLAVRAFGLAFAATGIGLILIAIATAALLIYKYWEPIKGFFSGLFTGIVEALGPVIDIWSNVFSAIAPVLAPVKELFVWIGNLLAPVEDVGGAAESMGLRFGRVIGGILNTIVTLPFKIIGVGNKIIQTIVDGMLAVADKPAKVMADIVSKVREYLPFSPAKVGPLRDLNRIKLVETVASSMSPAPMVKAMKQVTAATGAVLIAGASPLAPVSASVPILPPPPPAQGASVSGASGPVFQINDNRTIELNVGSNVAADDLRQAVLEALREERDELLEEIKRAIEFDERSDL